MMIEAAWTYRFLARIRQDLLLRHEDLSIAREPSGSVWVIAKHVQAAAFWSVPSDQMPLQEEQQHFNGSGAVQDRKHS